MDPRVNGMYFYTCIHTLKRNLKSCLLDQSIMAGIGNIYADEICFALGLDPRSRACKLSKKIVTKLFRNKTDLARSHTLWWNDHSFLYIKFRCNGAFSTSFKSTWSGAM